MFSFGIFTTHFPYIAVVAFYAYFLIFGVEKASKGEVYSENQFKIEIETENFCTDSNYDFNPYFEKNYTAFSTTVFEAHFVKCKLKHKKHFYPDYKQECFSYSIFSRPPPLA